MSASERNALGAIIVASPPWAEVSMLADRADFADPRHRTVWDALRACGLAALTSDLSNVYAAAERLGLLTDIGGAAYLSSLVDGVTKSDRWAEYLSPVRDAARGRRRELLAADYSREANREQRLLMMEQLAALDTPTGVIKSEGLADILRKPVEKAPWAVEGLLAEGDIAIMSGPGGVYKTWLTLTVMLSLARGGLLLDHYRIVRPRQVAFLDLETREWEVNQRLHRLCAGMNITPDDPACARVHVLRDRSHMNSREEMVYIEESLLSWGTEFLCVDSYRRFNAGDENESTANNELYAMLDHIRHRTGCGFLIIDHHRKKQEDKTLNTADQSLRGNSAKRDMLDNHIAVSRYEGNILFEPSKARHGAEQESIVIAIEGLTDDPDDTGPVWFKYLGGKDSVSDKTEDAIVAVLTSLGREASKPELINRTGYSERAIEKATAALKKRGRLLSLRHTDKKMYYRLEGVNSFTYEKSTT